MNEQPILSEAEWMLVIELLQQERDVLPVEIHHTRNADVRATLQQRQQMVRALLNRLSTLPATY